MIKEKVLLAGATGYLGQYIAKQLLDNKYPTKLIVRDKNNGLFNSAHFDMAEAQITNPESISGICENIDIVITTVGITKQKDGFTYMDVDYQANLNLLKEAQKNKVKKFIYVSAFRGEKLKHLKIGYAKELFVEELKKSGLKYCVVRPNGFFSDTSEFLKMAKKGTVQLFGDGNCKMNPIHGADVAKICIDAINSEAHTIEVGGPEVYTHNEIAELAFQALNKKTKIKYTPDWIRRLIIWLMRTFTSSKTYGPVEFFMTVLAMDMVAPKYGKHTLERFFNETVEKGI